MEPTTNIKQYFTFIEPVVGPWTLNPNYVFNNNFKGLDIKYSHLLTGMNDSRQLGVWEYSGDVPEQEVKNIVAERMQFYGYHEKSVESANAFATNVCGMDEGLALS